MPSLLEDARAAVELALKKGAQGAAASVARARNVAVDWRDGKLEKISEATTRGMGVSLYVDGRYSAVSTSDLRPEALDRLVGEAAAMARVLAVDPFRQLPDPSLYQSRPAIDLEAEDSAHEALDSARRRQLAQRIEEGARAADGGAALISVTASFADTSYEGALVISNGFEGTRRATFFSAGAEASVKDPDGRRPEESHYAASRFLADLPDVAGIGRIAAERALGRIGSRKMQSAVLPMVVENRVAFGLVGRLLGPAHASLLQQQRSFLDYKLGEPVGSALLDFADDPLVVRGLGSRLFDSEGISAKRFPLFEGGVLRNYYVDTYYGRKLKMAPTTAGQ
jgi:PmbA protein